MIHIDRNRADEQGRPIRPDDAWRKKAEASPARAGEINPGIYADERVKAALEKLFHEKCAYCETRVTASVRKYEAEGQVDVAADFRRHLEMFLLPDRCQYAGAARAVVRDPDAFGV